MTLTCESCGRTTPAPHRYDCAEAQETGAPRDAAPLRLRKAVHAIMGQSTTPRQDLEHALDSYERETGNTPPSSLDYLDDEGDERTQAFLAWYREKKRAVFEELERRRSKGD